LNIPLAIEPRSVVQTLHRDHWFDGISGNDVESGKRCLTDLRRMYPDEVFRLVQIIVEAEARSSGG
jgi:hypothetical protein